MRFLFDNQERKHEISCLVITKHLTRQHLRGTT